MDHRLWMYNMHYETGAGLKPEWDGTEQYFDEAPNEEARRFYDQLEESSRPLCEGSPHSALRNMPNRNDEGDIYPLFPPISIFNQNGRGSKKRRQRGFTDMEMQSAVTHILLNCPEIQSYVKLFVNTWGNEAIYTECSKWMRNYHSQHILEKVSDDELLNVEEEIFKNEENESFDDEE
ncbi:hypothetical protein H5410_056150 [Solanum commersonii]|uniref:Uncharacterized protein n=1 Tax=Solanum commersonii TaxID=4109 RepID=A0A9J5WLW0_SOLCO|nr:hypothetical protein H5410_056150 [Solanum commersonii]